MSGLQLYNGVNGNGSDGLCGVNSTSFDRNLVITNWYRIRDHCDPAVGAILLSVGFWMFIGSLLIRCFAEALSVYARSNTLDPSSYGSDEECEMEDACECPLVDAVLYAIVAPFVVIAPIVVGPLVIVERFLKIACSPLDPLLGVGYWAGSVPNIYTSIDDQNNNNNNNNNERDADSGMELLVADHLFFLTNKEKEYIQKQHWVHKYLQMIAAATAGSR